VNQYWKAMIAAATAGLIALQGALTEGGVSPQEWVTIALAAVGTVGVWAKSNADPPLPEIPGRHELKEDV
jgi:hypothetical protein